MKIHHEIKTKTGNVWLLLTLMLASSLFGCGYNALQIDNVKIKTSWTEVVNQYQYITNLIPNLVNTVKGCAAQEQVVLLGVTNARAKVGIIQATPELINNPEEFAKFQSATKISPSHFSVQQYFPFIFIFALLTGRVFNLLLGRFFGAIFMGGIIIFITWIFAGVFFIALVAGAIALLFSLFSNSMSEALLLTGLSRGRMGRGSFGDGAGGFGGGGASGRW